ncbi:hypothetical protein [Serinicoccus sp. CNJ-927]|uniref:hypothetical protein n=1 Tax=Serinicoccus sp. CNJ-927 TaxID=1904970 RepID=UPI00267D5094|nr:hypothetical protein [Serinicoccus sp. CNJ-927]
MDEPGPQTLRRGGAALAEHVEAGLLREGEALLDAAEGAPFEEVRRVDGMPGAPQLVGEGVHAGRQALDVVEEQYLSHA